MSHDLTVWVVDDAVIRVELTSAGFVEAEGAWLLARPDRAVTVVISAVDEDEVPDAVFARVAGITHRVHMMLNASIPAAFAAFDRLARKLAETGRGAVEGLASEPWLAKTARAVRVRPPAAPSGPRRVTQLALTWWFDPEGFHTPGMLEGLAAALRRHLPEALPRRYDSLRPNQRFRLAESGVEHFIRCLRDEESMTLVDPTAPCLLASYPHGNFHGWTTLASGYSGFAPCRLAFGFDSVILDDPLWQERLSRAWRELSWVVRPFYADIRLLDGLAVGRGGVGMYADADTHPAAGPFWEGIPREPAFARFIGAPYLDLWPLPATDGLAFLGPQDWAGRASDPTEVPTELASFPLPRAPGRLFVSDRQPAQVIPFARPAG